MRRLTRLEREALSEWRAEMALYAQGDLTAAARENLRWLMERTLETEITRQLGQRAMGAAPAAQTGATGIGRGIW